MRQFFRFALLLTILPLLTPRLHAGPAELTLKMLKNAVYAEYSMEDGSKTGVTYKLTNGEYKGKDPVWASFAAAAFGNLDHRAAAAVVIIENGGGSGEFFWLHLLEMNHGRMEDIDAAPIGDRSVLHGVKISRGEIIADETVAGPFDAAICPRERILAAYRLSKGHLKQVMSRQLYSAAKVIRAETSNESGKRIFTMEIDPDCIVGLTKSLKDGEAPPAIKAGERIGFEPVSQRTVRVKAANGATFDFDVDFSRTDNGIPPDNP